MSKCVETPFCLSRDLKLMERGVRDACFHCFCEYTPEDLENVLQELKSRGYFVTYYNNCQYFISNESLEKYDLDTDSWKILGYPCPKPENFNKPNENHKLYSIYVNDMCQWGLVWSDVNDEDYKDYVIELAEKFRETFTARDAIEVRIRELRKF